MKVHRVLRLALALGILLGFAGRAPSAPERPVAAALPLHLAWRYDGGPFSDVAASDAGEIFVCGSSGQITTLSPAGRTLRTLALDRSVSLVQPAHLRGGQTQDLLGWGNWQNTVFAYTGAGKPLWTYTPNHEGVDWVAPADGGKGEGRNVVVGYNGSGGLHLLGPDGQLLWRDTNYGNCWNVGYIAMDKMGDGVMASEAGGKIHLFGIGGRELRNIGAGYYTASLQAADLTGNGRQQIVAIGSPESGGNSSTEYVIAYDASGRLLWRQPLDNGNGNWRQKLIAVVPLGLGKTLVAVAADDDTLHLFTGQGHPVAIYQVLGDLQSLCAAKLRDGRPALILCTRNEVRALAVSLP